MPTDLGEDIWDFSYPSPEEVTKCILSSNFIEGCLMDGATGPFGEAAGRIYDGAMDAVDGLFGSSHEFHGTLIGLAAEYSEEEDPGDHVALGATGGPYSVENLAMRVGARTLNEAGTGDEALKQLNLYLFQMYKDPSLELSFEISGIPGGNGRKGSPAQALKVAREASAGIGVYSWTQKELVLIDNWGMLDRVHWYKELNLWERKIHWPPRK
jgi:hypothetical protein